MLKVILVSQTDQEIEFWVPGEISEISAVVGDASIKNAGPHTSGSRGYYHYLGNVRTHAQTGKTSAAAVLEMETKEH